MKYKNKFVILFLFFIYNLPSYRYTFNGISLFIEFLSLDQWNINKSITKKSHFKFKIKLNEINWSLIYFTFRIFRLTVNATFNQESLGTFRNSSAYSAICEIYINKKIAHYIWGGGKNILRNWIKFQSNSTANSCFLYHYQINYSTTVSEIASSWQTLY